MRSWTSSAPCPPMLTWKGARPKVVIATGLRNRLSRPRRVEVRIAKRDRTEYVTYVAYRSGRRRRRARCPDGEKALERSACAAASPASQSTVIQCIPSFNSWLHQPRSQDTQPSAGQTRLGRHTWPLSTAVPHHRCSGVDTPGYSALPVSAARRSATTNPALADERSNF